MSFGTVNFYLVQRGDKFGLRIKDSEAQTRTHFLGIDNFDIDPSWRIEAKWEAYNPPHEVEEANILGQVEKIVVPGAAVFERDGKTCASGTDDRDAGRYRICSWFSPTAPAARKPMAPHAFCIPTRRRTAR